MQRILSCLLLSLFSVVMFAQDRQADSLLQELKRASGNERQQISIYGALTLKMLALDVIRAKEYGRKAVDLAKANRYEPELAKAYVYLGYAYSSLGETEEGYKYADSGWRLASKHNIFEIKFSSQALMGGSKRKLGRYDEALEHYMQATKIAEAGNDKKILGKAYNMLGTLYVATNDLERADAYHRKALGVRLQTGDYGEIYQSYNNLGIIARELKQYDKALEYYFKAGDYAVKGGDSSDIAFIYNDIGAAYSFKGDVTNAESYLRASIGVRERMNELDELAYTYNYLGENYERKKDLTNAEFYIKKALATAIATHNNKQTYEAYESLSDFFARNHRYDSAYKYAMKFKYFKDSITKIDQRKIIAELNARFETAQKEKLIQKQEYEISKRNYWIAGIAGLLVMSTSLGYSRHKRNKLRQQAAIQATILHQQELATKSILEAEENERKRMATDLHDGVGQMMSAVKLNLSSLKTEMKFDHAEQQQAFENTLALVDDSCKEVRNVSHNIMPNSLLKSGLASAIQEFINKIDSRIIKVTLYSEGLNERLDTNTETVLYRIVQECVNNVIRHADVNTLDITLIRDDEEISISIEDNGKGFDTNETYSGIGLKNVRTRAGFLKGTVEWNSLEGKGTVVMVHVPV